MKRETPYSLFTRDMTPEQRVRWWKCHAEDDYVQRGFGNISRDHKNHMSIRFIEEYITPVRKRLSQYKGEECLSEWYNQSSTKLKGWRGWGW